MASAQNSSLLVVDDDAHIRRAISLRLGAAGYFVLEAPDADEAVRILEFREDIDLICTDVEMPRPTDGTELAAVVHERWPLTKIILMSGGRTLQPDDIPPGGKFVKKTTGVGEIISTVRRMMSLAPRLDLLADRLRHLEA